VAFAVKRAARLPRCSSDEAAGFTSCCGPRSCSLRRGFRHPARAAGISPRAWGLLPGAPALTRTGLAPAGDVQREASLSLPCWGSSSASSRRTVSRMYRRTLASTSRAAGARPSGASTRIRIATWSRPCLSERIATRSPAVISLRAVVSQALPRRLAHTSPRRGWAPFSGSAVDRLS
jgi:hypothetical protein